ncbi:hypothetical protein [Tenacibaculum sp. nBUS_03]|uniref:hypothetical protein n=1 Tax=Tenacibaculum sp. nBUS_03 TaxID=3395320 RepID=UPI003EBD2BE8
MLISLAVSMDSNLVEEYMLLIWRVPGFFGGYDSASVFSALGMVYLYLKKEINILIRYLIIILLFFTFFITARTGLFSLIMVALLTIMFKALSLRLKLGQLKVLIVSFSILATFFYINDNHLIVLPEEYEFVQSGINRLFEVFRNASTTGEIKTSSSDTLLKHHYHLPEDLKTLLIGNTFKSHQLGVYFFRSDVGYIELIYGGGLFVFSITCCLFLFMLKKVDRMKRNQFNSIFVFSLLIILLGMFKGKYLTSFHFINFVFFTYALTINNKLYEKK